MLSAALVRVPVQWYACHVPMRIWKSPVAVLAGFFWVGMKDDSAAAILSITGASGNASMTSCFGV